MKAAVLEQTNQPLSINHLEIPTLQKGQVLVKLSYSGVCHSQLMEARGQRGHDKYLPHLLGHEATGVVQAIGKDVSKVTINDRVVLGWIAGDGIDANCPKYTNQNGHTINAGKVTTFSEYTIVSENRVMKLPDDIPMDVGVLFGCAIPTGAGIVINETQPTQQSSIAIFGLGGIGLSALMATQLYDFKHIIAIDIEESKLQLAKDFGATQTLNAKETTHSEILEQILFVTSNQGLDYSIEASGLTNTIELAFKCTRNKGGLCIFASHPKAGEKIQIDPFDLICGKQIKGSWGGACHPDKDLPKFFDLYRKGKLPLNKMFDKIYTLDQINDALNDLENHQVIRPLIQLSP